MGRSHLPGLGKGWLKIDSHYWRRLQEVDKMIGEATGSPSARFVERCGGATIVDLLGRNNPWAADWCCGRLACLVCKGRALLQQEAEETEPTTGPIPPKPGKDDTKAAPKCTSEGAWYIVECWTCRKEGKKAAYIGETSRSPYQRGKKHHKEVAEVKKKTHPLVCHFEESHGGTHQTLLMRTLVETRTALER